MEIMIGQGAREDSRPLPEPGPSNQIPLVLVADDEQPLRELLVRMLERHTFVPITAETVAEAMAKAATHHVDAAIVDLGLRDGGSGLDLVQWLRAQPHYSQTPILILTGRIAFAEAEEALIRQHRAYVFYKPTPYSELMGYLRRLTDRHV
jgi:DNA-binding response OmpR family regulator